MLISAFILAVVGVVRRVARRRSMAADDIAEAAETAARGRRREQFVDRLRRGPSRLRPETVTVLAVAGVGLASALTGTGLCLVGQG